MYESFVHAEDSQGSERKQEIIVLQGMLRNFVEDEF
jgi:hypothetical protein